VSHHLTVQQLSSALDGALLGPSLEVVVRHLAVCADCRDRQSRLVRHDDVLRRLLSPEAGEAFLEALGARAEDIAVAIARGVQPPPMATTVPLLHEEDPYQPSEPPMDPRLGLDRLVAQEGGYGRIGMKPTASTQPPESDAAEARRWLDAAETGTPVDPGAFVSDPRGASGPDSSMFALPQWIEERASHSAPPPSREPQHLRLVPAPEEPPPFGAPEGYREVDPYAPRTLMPISRTPDPYPSRMPEYPPADAPPPAYAQAPRNHAEFDEPHHEPARYATAESGYATRGSAIAAARRRALEEARLRGLKRHWWIAGASVCVLLVIVLALQFAPAKKQKGSAAPRLEFARGDSSALAPPVGTGSPETQSASSRVPIDEVVPPKPRDVPADSEDVFLEDAPEDSVSIEPEQ
jgi:hypothetical protein